MCAVSACLFPHNPSIYEVFCLEVLGKKFGTANGIFLVRGFQCREVFGYELALKSSRSGILLARMGWRPRQHGYDDPMVQNQDVRRSPLGFQEIVLEAFPMRTTYGFAALSLDTPSCRAPQLRHTTVHIARCFSRREVGDFPGTWYAGAYESRLRGWVCVFFVSKVCEQRSESRDVTIAQQPRALPTLRRFAGVVWDMDYCALSFVLGGFWSSPGGRAGHIREGFCEESPTAAVAAAVV